MGRIILTLIAISIYLDWRLYRRTLFRASAPVRYLYLGIVAVVYISIAAAEVFDLAKFSEMPWLIWSFFVLVFSKLIYFAMLALGAVAKLLRYRGLLFERLAIGGAVVVLLAMVLGVVSTMFPRIDRVTLYSDRLPESFDGYKIALFSDTHVGSLPENSRLIEKLATRINDLDVDIVLFGGDLVNSLPEEVTTRFAEQLSSIRSKNGGVYSVLGNHDLGIYERRGSEASILDRMIRLQDDLGWQLLDNRTVYLYRGEDSISLSGVTFPRVGMNSAAGRQSAECDFDKAYDSVPKSLYNILLSHTPEPWPIFASVDGRGDLTLAGHTHAMQTKIEIGDFLFTPAQFMYRYASGLYSSRDDISLSDFEQLEQQDWASALNISEAIDIENAKQNKYLYVNDGYGYVMLPARIGCPPEITLITLKCN